MAASPQWAQFTVLGALRAPSQPAFLFAVRACDVFLFGVAIPFPSLLKIK